MVHGVWTGKDSESGFGWLVDLGLGFSLLVCKSVMHKATEGVDVKPILSD